MTPALDLGRFWTWEWAEDARLIIGTFVTSPGAGGTAAVVAAYLAYRGIATRLAGEKTIADKHRADQLVDEARQRWWDALMLLWGDSGKFADNPEVLQEALEALESAVTTEEQRVMLKAMSLVLIPPVSEDEEPDHGEADHSPRWQWARRRRK